MADLAQALSEIKSLPDIALRHALSRPDGTIPGFLALSELHERKRIRASAGDQTPAERPSMAQEYMGMETARTGFAAGGAVPKGLIPEGLTNPNMVYRDAALNPLSMYGQPGRNGIVDLIMPGNAAQPTGLESLAPQMPGELGAAREPQHYAEGGIVGLARGGHVSAVDPRLWDVTHRAAQGFPYQVQFVSGYRPGDPRFHGEHKALDVQLIDPRTGQALENYQSGDTYGPYWEYAQRVKQQQQELYPDMNVRWGGFNRGESDKRTYGAADWMHYDVGNVPQRGGSWSTGINADMAQQYGVDPRYVGQGMGQSATGGMSNYQRALLDTIAGTESPGYNVIYGGQTFNDYSRHPGIAVPIKSGPNMGDVSTAAGRYQFLQPTWNDLASRYGYKDFSPANQDQAAWSLAQETYGPNLLRDLQSGDAATLAQIGQKLSGKWTSLPGGIESAGGTDRFVAAYQQALGNPTAMAAAATSGASNAVAQAAAKTGTDMTAADSGMGDFMMMAQLLGGMGQQAPAPTGGGPVQSPEIPIDPRTFYRRTVPVRRFA